MNYHLLLSVTIFAVVSSAHAVDLTYGSLDPNNRQSDNAVILTGEIRKGDYDAIRRFARKDPDRFHSRTVVLASQGGDLIEAIRIGTFLRKTYMTVFVNPDIGRCASACFLIYVAAVERSSVVPGLGIHRPYFAPSEFQRKPLPEAEKKNRQLMRAVRNYLDDQEVPHYLIEKMFSLASTEIYWLNWEDLNRLGTRANWWDQVLVDRCRLNKGLEQEYLNRGDDAPRAAEAKKHIHEVAVCSYEISAHERFRNLIQLLNASK
jgi:hypothetical protein